jgi:bla regulator protein BlaR1
MIAELVDHLWQSTLFVGAAWLLTLALKKNRAQVRYWVWFAASVKFLVPLAFLVAVGELAPRHAARPMARTEWVAMAQQVSEPSIDLPAVGGTANRARRDYLAPVALAVWACGFLCVAICWLARLRRVGALRRLATPVSGIEFAVPVMSAPGLVEPGIFGIFRPALLLPEGIAERLSPAQLDAILAHELCHVRRKDNLTATIHMIVQATFWFHPLVWWLGARLIDERERACDEEVLRLGNKPGVYAEAILNVCKLYVESPLACVSGVTGSNLRRRIEAIMKNRIALRLNFGKKFVLAVTGVAAVAAPVAVGIMNAPLTRAQSVTAAPPKFEVAAIRPCKSEDPSPRRGSGGVDWSPGRLSLACTAVERLIWSAYVLFANDRYNGLTLDIPISGDPGWAKSDSYQIDAKAEGPQSWVTMSGSMVRALLEDRFKLKLHREIREIPVYALTVAKGGPKLQPFKEGTCIARDLGDPEHSPLPRLEPGQPLPLICGMGRLTNNGYDLPGMTMATFGRAISFELDRPVIDRTGIVGMFTIHLDLSPADLGRPDPDSNDPAAPRTQIDRLPAVGSAIGKLGLKLQPSKGPGEFIVIDHVEKPSEN